MSRVLRGLVLSVASTLAAAQVSVPGDFESVQAAIDAAAPGSVITINGISSTTLVIDKPLTLIGSPSFSLDASDLLCDHPSGLEYACPAITLIGQGSGDVTLVNMQVGGTLLGDAFAATYPSIFGGGFDTVTILDSDVRGTTALSDDPTQGGRAIEVWVDHLVISNSSVIAGRTAASQSTFAVFDGAVAIAAPTVTLLDSIVRGGSIADAFFIQCPTTCDEVTGGRGGPGIVANTLFRSNSIVTGGAGISTECASGPIQCQKPDGPPLLVDDVVVLPSYPTSSGLMHLGQTWSVTWLTESLPSLLVYSPSGSPGAITPTQIAAGWAFVDPAFATTLVIPPGLQTASFDVPNDSSLLGAGVTLQTFDPVSGLSRPLFTTVTP